MVAFVVYLLLTGAPLAAAEGLSLPLKISVEASRHPLQDAPISFELPAAPGKSQALELIETTGGNKVSVPSQIEPGNPPRLWWVLAGKTPAGGQRTFELRGGRTVKTTEVIVDELPNFLVIRQGGSPVLRYNSAHVDPPKGAAATYGRSAYIHPLWTPAGKVVTDEFPPDHMHQDGVFLAFTKTEFEGRQPNFWDLHGGTGRVRFKEVLGMTSGPVFGGFRVLHEHVDLTVPKGKVALTETWDVRVWNVGGPKGGYWICDVSSSIRSAVASPLRLPKYHYGGMAIRGARGWDPQHSRFLTADGKDRLAGNHTRTRWCDLSGDVDGGQAGVTFMTHPKNFRFPEPLRIHPTMPYMVYCPSHVGDWEIKPGREHVSRYRLYIHDGKLKEPEAERVCRDFAEPPTVRLESGGNRGDQEASVRVGFQALWR